MTLARETEREEVRERGRGRGCTAVAANNSVCRASTHIRISH